ncbi:MAG: nuclear transport factor 2 family protein [Gammaproteobacteria bacterium]
MGSIDKQLAELVAREAIRELPQRYCDCVWRNDIDGLVDLFTADGRFVAEMSGITMTVVGQDDIRAMFDQALGMQPRPYIHNHVIELAGDGFASGRCYLDLRSARRDFAFLGAGYYEDDYLATPAGWKFHSRRFFGLYMAELPEGLVQDAS